MAVGQGQTPGPTTRLQNVSEREARQIPTDPHRSSQIPAGPDRSPQIPGVHHRPPTIPLVEFIAPPSIKAATTFTIPKYHAQCSPLHRESVWKFRHDQTLATSNAADMWPSYSLNSCRESDLAQSQSSFFAWTPQYSEQYFRKGLSSMRG